mmetsp:Transcript_19585/g.25903  ORF Transcript_19585/g.25903 Transcript_19585/m.25903 type:complete len:151 (-) Transcript_19585:637-1089(-)
MSDILENFINQGRFYVNEIPPVTQLAIAVLVATIGYLAVLGAAGLLKQPIRQNEDANTNEASTIGLNKVKIETKVESESESTPRTPTPVPAKTPERNVSVRSDMADETPESSAPQTPSETPTRRTTRSTLGSLETPSGRRSARIARKRKG